MSPLTDKPRKSFQTLIERMEGLPTLPASVAHVLSILDNSQSSAKELTEALSVDQSLASRLLKMVNSVYFGFPRRIDTLQQAVAILGFRAIRDIVTVTSLFHELHRTDRKLHLNRRLFWRHAVGCGVAARVIGLKTGTARGEGVFLAGLLHDIGKVFFDAYLHEEYAQVIRTATEHSLPLYQAEERVLGANHTDFGHWLADAWNLPFNLTAAAAYHHRPSECRDHFILACLVHTSNTVVQALELGDGGEVVLSAIEPMAWTSLHLTHRLLEDTIPTIVAEVDQAYDLFAWD